ncbi:hypothetical protein ATO13_23161 [Stappia sp. 22II-S9-Z10]|nr:hypothetical protein ATO13_23161 [Stappia sp. 22II-S9-Z10]
MMRALLLCTTALVCITTPADAGPLIPIVTGVGSAVSSLGGLGTVAKLGLGLVSTVVPMFMSRQRPQRPEDVTRESEGEEGPARWAMGRVLLSGMDAFCNSREEDTYLNSLLVLGPIDGIEETFYDKRIITVRDDGKVDTPPFIRPDDDSWMRLWFRDGDGYNAHYPQLSYNFPQEITDEFCQHGNATMLARLRSPGQGDEKQIKLFQKVVGNGIKTAEVLARVCPVRWVYDPRTDTSGWTRNGVLLCRHLYSLLPGSANDGFDDDTISELADEADALEDKIILLDFNAQSDLTDDRVGSIVVDGTCEATYEYEYRLLTTTGSSATNVLPRLNFDDVLDDAIGLPTTIKMTLSRDDADKFVAFRMGSVAPTVTRDEVLTHRGASVRVIEATGTPDGGQLGMLWNGTGGPLEAKIDRVQVTAITQGPFCTLDGGGQGAITMETFLDACESAGLHPFRNNAGAMSFRWIWDVQTPEVAFTEEDEDILYQKLQEGPEEVECPNLVKIKFFSAEQRYTPTELAIQQFDLFDSSYIGPAWARHQDDIDDNGEKPFELELKYCGDATQAARIGRWRYLMERADSVMTTLGMAGMLARGRQVFDLDLVDMAEDGGPLSARVWKEGAAPADDETGATKLLAKVIPTELLEVPWDTATHGVAPPPTVRLDQYKADIDTPPAPYAACWIKYQSGGAMSGAYEMRIGFQGVSIEDAVVANANYRGYDESDLPQMWASMEETSSNLGADVDSLRYAWKAGDFRDEKLDFRVFVFNDDGDGSHASDLLEIASLAVNNTEPDPPAGTVTPNFDDGEGGTFTTAPTVDIQISVARDISAVRCVVEMASPPLGTSYAVLAEVDVRPDDVFEVADVNVSTAGTYNIRARTETTDGTASDWWETTYTTAVDE